MADASTYPVRLDVAPPEKQSRLTVFFRPLLALPSAIVLEILFIPVALFTLIAWFALVIAGKYPGGLFRFSANVFHWWARLQGYALLLTGKYPPFALGDVAGYPITLAVDEATSGRSRLTVFFRPILVIPHLIVLEFIVFAAQVCVLISWFAALFTGQVPGGLHGFIGGALRWQTRVMAYYLLLTDKYPPFSLS